MQISAVIAVVSLALIAGFQVALALGAPLGSAAWGGQHAGVLPSRFRVASGVAAVLVYPLVIAAVLAASGLVASGWLPGTGRAVMWVLTGFFGLGAVMNAVSRSKPERIWAPVSLLIAICCGIIAVGLATS